MFICFPIVWLFGIAPFISVVAGLHFIFIMNDTDMNDGSKS